MKKSVMIVVVILLSLLVNISFISAAICRFDGEEIPCDIFWKKFLGSRGVLLIVMLLYGAFVMFMAFDFMRRVIKNSESANKNWVIKWALILILTVGIGAIFYYFKIYKKFKKGEIPK